MICPACGESADCFEHRISCAHCGLHGPSPIDGNQVQSREELGFVDHIEDEIIRNTEHWSLNSKASLATQNHSPMWRQMSHASIPKSHNETQAE